MQTAQSIANRHIQTTTIVRATTTTVERTIGKVSIDRLVWNSRACVREGCLLRGEHYPWHYFDPSESTQWEKMVNRLSSHCCCCCCRRVSTLMLFFFCALSNLPKHLKLTILAVSSLLSEVGDFALLTCWRRQNPICMSINLQKIRWQRARHRQTQAMRERKKEREWEGERLSCSHVVGCLLLFAGLAWVGQIGYWLMCSRSRRGDELPRD